MTLESKLRNAARRAAVKFFVAGINAADEAEVSQAVHDFEDQLATLEGSDSVTTIEFFNPEHCVWCRFEDCSVEDMYDFYHFLVEDFVKEALRDF